MKRIYIIMVVLAIVALCVFCYYDDIRLDEKDAIYIEENLTRCGGRYVVPDSFDIYYNLRDESKTKLPLLLNISGDLNGADTGNILDDFKNLEIMVVGPTPNNSSKLVGGILLTDGIDLEHNADMGILDLYIRIPINSDESYEITKDNINEVTYLKKYFNDFIELSKVGNQLSYSIANNANEMFVSDYRVSIHIYRDNYNEMIIKIMDSGQGTISIN